MSPIEIQYTGRDVVHAWIFGGDDSEKTQPQGVDLLIQKCLVISSGSIATVWQSNPLEVETVQSFEDGVGGQVDYTRLDAGESMDGKFPGIRYIGR